MQGTDAKEVIGLSRIGWCSESASEMKRELDAAYHIVTEIRRQMIRLDYEAQEGSGGLTEFRVQWRKCLFAAGSLAERLRTFSTSVDRADQLLSETEKRLMHAGSLLESSKEEKPPAINCETRAGLSWIRPPAGAQRASEADYEARFGGIHNSLPPSQYHIITAKTHPADTVGWEYE